MKNRKRPHPNDALWDAYVEQGRECESLVCFAKRLLYTTNTQPGELLENWIARSSTVERGAAQYVANLTTETIRRGH